MLVRGAAVLEGCRVGNGIRKPFLPNIGITDYLEKGGDVNIAKRMAGRYNVKTTEL